jgi:hypothetical protein
MARAVKGHQHEAGRLHTSLFGEVVQHWITTLLPLGVLAESMLV